MVTVSACALPCPARKPTTNSDEPGVTVPESGVVPMFDVPVETSTGLAAAMPENSKASNAIDAAVATWIVTVVVAAALAEYHSSPSEKCPEAKYAPMRVQVLPAESVIELMWLVAPV